MCEARSAGPPAGLLLESTALTDMGNRHVGCAAPFRLERTSSDRKAGSSLAKES